MLEPLLIFIEPARLEEPWVALVYVDWTMVPIVEFLAQVGALSLHTVVKLMDVM